MLKTMLQNGFKNYQNDVIYSNIMFNDLQKFCSLSGGLYVLQRNAPLTQEFLNRFNLLIFSEVTRMF